jgi:sulfite reductase (NADPH) hemoprotein beta-component
MYKYNNADQKIVDERVAQYADQVKRRLNNELTEDEFRPLRLQNGLYMQKHAYMLRVAIPYGLLNSEQMRTLALIAKKYDNDYGHFTTRQNIQYNWLKLEDTPEILAHLAKVEMHAIQTSGNCVRNITSDEFAGVAQDEYIDPRPFAEILRQWSTFHPEFAYLPRKFKIAISASAEDRAATSVHDIGLYVKKDDEGKPVLDVLVGGGLGRTPIIGHVIKKNLPWQHMATYIEAILRVYNLYGRRDNIYKARIKILVKSLGAEEFAKQVDKEWQELLDSPYTFNGINSIIPQQELDRVTSYFIRDNYKSVDNYEENLSKYNHNLEQNQQFKRWVKYNVKPHKQKGYASVLLSLKPYGNIPPGDANSEQMYAIADIADEYSFGQIRVTHEQNLVLADVEQERLFELWEKLKPFNLATSNIGLITDIIACPGGDFCSLANAKSIPIATSIQAVFDDLDYVHDIGDLSLNISGCINSCGHHHIGNIGVLGVDKDGEEWYQVSLGGSQGNNATIGKIIGPSFKSEQMPSVIQKIVLTYIDNRTENEFFIDTFRRIGVEPFKVSVYSNSQ